MRDRQLHVGVGGRTRQKLAVQCNGALVLAKADAGGGIQSLVVEPVLRILPHELFKLAAGVRLPMQLDEDLGVLGARSTVVRSAV